MAPLTPPRARPWLAPLALLALVLLLTWPTAATLRTHAVDRQDPLLNAWIMAWEARQLVVDPARLFDANIFFPQGNTLAFSELVLSTSALVMPLQWLTGDALLAYNVAFLLAFFTTALGGYLLALYLTGRRGPALVAGIGLAFAPYNLGHLSQVQLLYAGWLPLALLYLDRLLRGRRPARDAALLALFLLLQALASFYSALFAAAACLVYVLLPLAQPYFEVQRTLGAGWTLEQNEQFSASLQAYAYPPASSPAWGWLSERLYYTYAPCCPPDSLFPTVTLLALALVALWKGRGGRRGLWLLLAALAVLLSLGPLLKVEAGVPTGISLPYGWLWAHVPGFDAIRAPVRWGSLVVLALAMLAALGLARLGRDHAPWLVALALLLVEVAPMPLRLVPVPEPFPALAWLDAQPPTTILELPLVAQRPVEAAPLDQPRLAWERSRLLEAQFFSTRHWHRTPDGYSGYVPARHGDFAREIAAFPSERSIALLRGLGVRYVMLHEADATPQQLAAWADAPLPEATRVGTDRVLALEPAAPARAPVPWLPVTTFGTEQPTLALALRGDGTRPYVPVAESPAALTLRWVPEGGGEGIEEMVNAPWPMIVEQVALMRLPATLPPPGRWTLRVEGAFPSGEPLRAEALVEVVEGPARAEPLPVRLRPAGPSPVAAVDLQWEAVGFLERYYGLSVTFFDPQGTRLLDRSGPPDDEVPTIAWLPGVPYGAQWSYDEFNATHAELRWSDSERPETELLLWDGEAFVPVHSVAIP